MGSKKGKSTTVTRSEFPSETGGLRDVLIPFMSQEGSKESPFYSDLRRMFTEVADKSPSRFNYSPYITNTLESAVSTGLPGLTPLEETPYYKSTYPAMKRSIYEDIIPAVTERFGAGGGLRTTDYAKAATSAGGKAMSDYILNAASQAYTMEEAAKQRRMTALPTAIGSELGAYGLPYDLLNKLVTAAGGAEDEKYPLLDLMIRLATANASGGTTSTTTKEGFDWGSLISAAVSSAAKVGAAL